YSLMFATLRQANYWLLVPGILFMFVSHWLRAIRWGYFMAPIKKIDTPTLFSAVMIGYCANNIFPLRLGEILRPYALGKATGVSRMATFATIFVERLIDVLSLLLLLAVSLVFHDYPEWIKSGTLVVFSLTLAGTIFIVFLMLRTHDTLRLVDFLMTRFPQRARDLVHKLLHSFLDGFTIFKKSEHYWAIIWQSVVIWFFYAAIIYFTLEAFGFNQLYALPPGATIVILVMASLGLMVPAAPASLGTFHLICQQALMLFHVPQSESLSFAIILHLANFVPVTLVGLYYYYKQEIRLSEAKHEPELSTHHGPAENPLHSASEPKNLASAGDE
ncbi:MAG: lysylphosphatidylglycerol synthase transmembrane domain-containing protein, partial [candidate division KSB1 bacterium]